ncbi:MAG TPA: LysR family transcriptional regulator [Ramlibacter sp.]|nr:LysR family transcriptional regulator [Ramlibacter sp.]
MHQPASVLLNRLLARARFRHLQVLVQVAELGSVRRAADAIGMTQPAISQILADLEVLLDTPLFHRHARGVRPTPACTDLLPMARQMLLGLAASAEAVAARTGAGEGVVRLAASTAVVNGLLVQALPAFNQRVPGIQVQLVEIAHDLLLAATRGEADLLGIRQPPVVPEGWTFRPLIEDPFVVACAADHPLTRRRQLEWSELAGETWLPGPVASAARQRFETVMAPWAKTLRVCQVITRVPAATWALLRGQRLLTVVPFSVVRHLVEAGELAVLRMREPMLFDPLGLLIPQQDASAAVQRLVDFLEEFARERARRAGS